MSSALQRPVCFFGVQVKLTLTGRNAFFCGVRSTFKRGVLGHGSPNVHVLLCHCDSPHGETLPPPGQPAAHSRRVSYVTGNLFSCPEGDALAHCISEDCRMGAGIAVTFKQKFKGVQELKEQKKLTGQCAVLKRGERFVYYLITKKKANHKPTYDSLKQSLEDMRSHCVRNRVTRISMPRIGCGLDRLHWNRVSVILEQVFRHTDISITVYSLPERAETTVMNENARR